MPRGQWRERHRDHRIEHVVSTLLNKTGIAAEGSEWRCSTCAAVLLELDGDRVTALGQLRKVEAHGGERGRTKLARDDLVGRRLADLADIWMVCDGCTGIARWDAHRRAP